MSVRPPVTSRGSTISIATAFAGYAAAWVLGQMLFVAVVATADGTGIVDLVEDDPIPVPLLFVGTAVSWSIYLGMLWWVSQREATGRPVADFRLWFDWRDVIGLPVGAVTQIALLPALYWPLNEVWPDTFNEDKLAENAKELVDSANGIGVALLIVMVVVGAPLVEELVYRGLLQGALVRRLGSIAGLPLAAAFFAVIHFRPVEYPGLFVAGLVFGCSVLITGRLGTAIAAHAAFNAIGLLVAAG